MKKKFYFKNQWIGTNCLFQILSCNNRTYISLTILVDKTNYDLGRYHFKDMQISFIYLFIFEKELLNISTTVLSNLDSLNTGGMQNSGH